MIKLVAFDWNGTIFADTYSIFRSNNESFKHFKINPPSFAQFQKYYDVPVKKLYLAMGVTEEELEKNAQKVVDTFMASYEPSVHRIRTRAYARELLLWLSKNNIRAVIFSNHTIDSIQKHLKRLKIDKYFAEVIANTMADFPLKDKTKKDKLKNYMEKHKISSHETMIIGDTTEEIEIGKELGVRSIAITHGNMSISRLKKAKPDYLVSSLKGITGIITNC